MILIRLEDIRKIRPSAQIPADRLTPFIQEAQRFELKNALGDAFYRAIESEWDTNNKFTTVAYQELLEGKEYTYNGDTIYYSGLKDMLSYLVLGRFISEQQVNITRYGVVQKTIEQSEPISSAQIKTVSEKMFSLGYALRDELTQFLDENLSTYPLYSSAKTKVNKNETGFGFFTV